MFKIKPPIKESLNLYFKKNTPQKLCLYVLCLGASFYCHVRKTTSWKWEASLLGRAVQLTRSPSRQQKGGLWRWEGADGPGGAGATQFHGVFSADVSVVTHATVQFGHWQGWWIDPTKSHCEQKKKTAHFQAKVLFYLKKTNQRKKNCNCIF